MNPGVDHYLTSGCGRCDLYDTPQCRVHRWHDILVHLRGMLLSCGLTEEIKWGNPCYTYQKKNVVILGAFKEWCAISFFKGALLQDPEGILQKAGENTQSGRVIRFTALNEVLRLDTVLRSYVIDAIEAERSGAKAVTTKQQEAVPEELLARFRSFPALREAFESLTPGRQRGYLLFISEAKQSKTREARIDKCMPMILGGIGLHDAYKGKK
jgi:uncharacterized protein YdeI (YjbR/CyaY-like superfamily)